MRWIPVTEKLPPYNEPVLVVQMNHWNEETNEPVVTLQRRTHTDVVGEHWERADWRKVDSPPIGLITHWMWLPLPPEKIR